MPELPEIENLVLELRTTLKRRTISQVEILNDSILKTPKHWLEETLPGKRVIQIERRGKFIPIRLSGGFTLWFHLGMTGQLLFEDLPPTLKSHTHFILSFADSTKRLFYRDVRRFGQIALMPYQGDQCPQGVRRLGPEPREWNPGDFISLFKERRARIKNLLLDQKMMAGLGNIYADESLHRSGIHPLRKACRVPRHELARLYGSICRVLEEAIQGGGSSIDDYVHLNGQKGRFQEFHLVYGREGEECQACGTPIRKVRLSGRSSYFCPKCQH